jgi:hypothetical protein
LVPVEVQRLAVQWEHNVIGDKVCRGQEHAPPAQQGHAKNAAVQGDDGVLDDTDAPGIDVDVGERNLAAGKYLVVCMEWRWKG